MGAGGRHRERLGNRSARDAVQRADGLPTGPPALGRRRRAAARAAALGPDPRAGGRAGSLAGPARGAGADAGGGALRERRRDPSGLLRLPAGSPPYPAVVLLPGSLATSRRALWSYYATGEGHAAAAAAIAALRDEPWFEAAGLPAAVRAPEELAELPARLRTFLAQWDLDPLAALGALRCPVLAVYGAADDRLPVARNAEILRELAARTRVPLTVQVLPGLDHDLQAISGDATGNAPAPEASAVMARWAAAQVAAGNTAGVR
ncbi:MAG TPA: hypothetical protein VMS86_07855 [Thermoanaerobaculia bacterium]|nr:hypothetical protein [Thermoanaerobaculia bacterium]